ncbi:isopeptide-forming domain-containing fimbrial protein [Bifidobacterium saguinibicoloris]|uniref:isopeptide-forming domain-containing fimbrial protein n=1 Tax=Bifidobacterium saguinibicoloris TaxID=2834433 RepID=UPI001C58707E|nr:isopeptide-forming domain-containing fimbrial protein [Bifidobacterium saguinibicoloris]MBW3081149.1 isopeptide-forming domain-containing fimbrial protein [Bifidobacterium saguinibicoloris]
MQLRKLFAGVAAAATLLGGFALGAATANAAEVTLDDTYQPTITLNKVDDKAENNTYTAYRIASYTDAVVDDQGRLTSVGLEPVDGSQWDLKISDAMTAAQIEKGDAPNNLYAIARLDTVKDGAKLRAFVKALQVPTKLGSDEPSVTGTPLTLGQAATVPAAGWYFVTDSNGTNLLVATALKDANGTVYTSLFDTDATPATEQKLGVADVKPDVAPTPDKKVDGSAADNTAEVGQKLSYAVSGKVPNTTGYETYTFAIKDVASKGLTVNADSIKVFYDENSNGKLDGNETALTAGTDYTLSGPTVDATTGQTTTTVTLDNVAGNDGKTITLAYTALVNGDALDKVTNTATVSHNGGTESGGKTVTTTLGKFQFTKVDAKGAGVEGAYFDVVYSGDGIGNALVFKKVGEGEYVRAADKKESDYTDPSVNREDKDVKVGEYTTRLRTPKSGVVKVEGLKAWGYVVREQKPAEGYMQSVKANFTVRIDENGNPTVTKGKADDLYGLVTIPADKTTATVLNVKNVTELPKTGAAGIALFVVLAGLLAGAAATVFAKSRNTKRALNA